MHEEQRLKAIKATGAAKPEQRPCLQNNVEGITALYLFSIQFILYLFSIQPHWTGMEEA